MTLILASGIILISACPAERLHAGSDGARTEEARERDWHLTIRARMVLLRDQALAPLNLGVTVRERVATVWGVVPNRALIPRALDRVRHVPGMAEALSELQIEDSSPVRSTLLWEPLPVAGGQGTETGHTSKALTSNVTTAAKEATTSSSAAVNPLRPKPDVRGPGATLLPIEPEPNWQGSR